MKTTTGLLCLYLVAFSYCDEIRKTVFVPTIDSSKEWVTPEVKSIKYNGTTECDYAPDQAHFFMTGGKVIQVLKASESKVTCCKP